MRRPAIAEGWSGQVLVFALALLTVAAGLCLFDEASGADRGMPLDFCAVGALVPVAPVLLGLALSGQLEAPALGSRREVSLGRLDPPPES